LLTLDDAAGTDIIAGVAAMRDLQYAQKAVQLRTVFHTLSHGRPMVAYEQQRELNEENGLPNLAAMHWSDNAGWDIAESLDLVVQSKAVEFILNARFLSFSLDESTDVSHQSRMVLHIYALRDWQRIPVFVGLPRVLGSPDAANLTDLAINTLKDRLKMTDQHLSSKTVMVACDGASVLQGRVNGLVQRVRQDVAPFAQPMHCMAHRVDLAAGVLDNHSLVSLISELVTGVNAYYCRSSMRSEQLQAVQAELALKLHAMLRDILTRWISHYAPMQRVSDHYPALVKHATDAVAECTGAQLTAAMQQLSRVTDLERYLGLAALLPMLKELNRFIKVCSFSTAVLLCASRTAT